MPITDNCFLQRPSFQELRVNDPAWGWMRLLIEEATGRVIIVSDYGTWSYCWSHIGDSDIFSFLLKLDWQYCGKKMLGEHFYEHDDASTVNKIRKGILQYRRDATLSAQEAADEWHLVQQYADGYYSFQEWGQQTEFIEDWYEWSQKVPDGCWMNLWNHLWVPYIQPALRDLIKRRSTTLHYILIDVADPGGPTCHILRNGTWVSPRMCFADFDETEDEMPDDVVSLGKVEDIDKIDDLAELPTSNARRAKFLYTMTERAFSNAEAKWKQRLFQ